jgi:hypothetical protein
MEMVLPGLAGYWLDRWLGTPGVLTVVGFMGGLALGIYHLLQMARPERGNKQKEDQR